MIPLISDFHLVIDMAVHNLSMFFGPTTSTCPPPDVTFLVKSKECIVTEVKAHKQILAFASDVFNSEFYGSMTSEDVIEVTDSHRSIKRSVLVFKH